MRAFLILIFILTLAVLIFIIKSKNKTIQNKTKEIDRLQKQVRDKEIEVNLINKEMEIEKRYNKELAKRLADIGNMSIDDVLHELQNDNNRKDNGVHSGS